MKGLLIKDFKLMKNQKNFFFIMIFIAAAMLFAEFESTFVVSYFTMIASMFVLSTISYDEYDNGYAFLFSMPFSRTSYVKEKYVFSILVGGGAWLLSVVLSGILITIRNSQLSAMAWLPIHLLYICIVLLFAAVMIPVQLKFGGERGRVALLLTVGVAVLGSMGVIKLLEILQVDLDAVLASMNTLNMMQIGGAAGIFSIVLLAISYRISCRVMKNKEF